MKVNIQEIYDKSIMVCIGIAILFIVLTVGAIVLYLKGKKKLKLEEATMRKQIKQEEKRLQEKIKEAEEEMEKRKKELDEKIQQFNREQALREDISRKSDRDVLVELHVKVLRIFATLGIIDKKIENITHYSEKIDILERNLDNRISDLKKSIKEDVVSRNNDGVEDLIETMSDRIMGKLYYISEDISDISGTVDDIEDKINDYEYSK